MDIIILILCLLLCIVIICDLSKYCLYTEHYDASIKNISLDKCTSACKLSSNCNGFGYNSYDSICYPSKNIINGKILGQLYSNKYDTNNITCNKFFETYLENKPLNENDRKNNSIFTCTKNNTDTENMFYHYNGKLVTIQDPSLLENIEDIDYYKTGTFPWPLSKFDEEKIENTVNSNIKVYHEENNEYNKQEALELEKLNSDENNLDKYINEYETDINENKVDTNSNSQESKKSNIYEISPSICLGNNLYNYECVTNVDLNKCLKECTNNDQCKGVEWNPLYLKLLTDNIYRKHKDVCCLKNNMNKLDDRDTNFKTGKSYIKRSNIENNNKYYIF